MAQEFLNPGDIVDVIAPGFRCAPEAVKKAISKLKLWGFVARVPQNLLGPDLLAAQADSVRWEHLKTALMQKDSKLVWCLRGGYGSIRLLDPLAQLSKPKNAKWVLGFSDITFLHSFLYQKWGWKSLHGPLFERFGQDQLTAKDEKMLFEVLTGKLKEYCFSHLTPLNSLAKKAKVVRGPLIGGNLSVVVSTLGTPWAYTSHGKILFFEDIGERGYRVDRMLIHLKQAHFFKGAKAIIFGDFTGGQEPNGRSLCGPVLQRWATEMNIPVFKGLPIGHGRRQAVVPIGTLAVLKMGPKAKLYVTYQG